MVFIVLRADLRGNIMATRESILETSTRLFMSRGCKSLTMDEIAAECGVSKRTLYEQFNDKSTLLEACIISMNVRNGKKIDEITGGAKNVLEKLLMIHSYQTDASMDIYGGFFKEVSKYFPDVYDRTIHKMRMEQIKYTEKMLLQGQKEGVFVDYIPYEISVMAVAITEMVNVIKNAEVFVKANIGKKDVMMSSMIIYLRGFSTEMGRELIDNYLKHMTTKTIKNI